MIEMTLELAEIIAKAKAMAAASFKRSTMEIDGIKDQNPLLWFSLPNVVPGNVLPSPLGHLAIQAELRGHAGSQ